MQTRSRSRWLPWKYQQAVGKGGAVVGLGTDVGSLAVCYRKDPVAKAGLPTNRVAVSKLWPTWQAYIAAGKRYQAKAPKGTFFFDTGVKRLQRDDRHEAADLKRRFNRDFWVEDGEYFALALDPDGRQVDSLTSNNGHLLWSGIVDKSKARAVARHLLGPRLFSGWGVRTLADGEGRYNPIGYHTGTVWPFDNSFVAWGLRRYGFKDEAAEIASGILDAADFFDGRLPEAFGGYPREQTKYPVQYPTACSPQAWSTERPCSCCAPCSGSSLRASTCRRSGASERHRPPGVARHSRPLGPH